MNLKEGEDTKINRGRYKSVCRILFSIVILLFLLISGYKAFAFPKDINYYENRDAYQVPGFSIIDFLTSQYQDGVEKAFSDQIIGAQWMKKQYNDLSSAIILPVLDRAAESYPDQYFRYKGLLLHKDYLLWEPFDLEEFEEVFRATADGFNKVIQNNPDIDFYLFFVDTDATIDFQTGSKTPVYALICRLMDIPEENCADFSLDSFQQYSREFYRTDHHWNHIGSYRGYVEAMKLLQIEDDIKVPVEEIAVSCAMTGSKALQAGLTSMEESCKVYRFDYPDLGIKYGHEQEVVSDPQNSFFNYGYFYGDNDGLLVFQTEDNTRDSILIIGDSYDNAVLKLIATHFYRTYSVDLRTYENDTGEVFHFNNFLQEHDEINRVLIFASQVVYCGDYIVED